MPIWSKGRPPAPPPSNRAVACSLASSANKVQGKYDMQTWALPFPPLATLPLNIRLLPKPGCKGIGFRQISLNIYIFYTINEAHKQYSLLDTIFNHIFHLGPPGKYLYSSPKNQLYVGRRSRPTCSRFSGLVYTYFPGGPR